MRQGLSFLLVVLFVVSRPILASGEACVPQYEQSFASIEYSNIDSADVVDIADADVEAQRYQFQAIARLPSVTTHQMANDKTNSTAYFGGIAHEYRSVEFNNLASPPQTNGDLHTLQLPMQRWQRHHRGERRLGAAVVIASSSNALKNLDELTTDNLQLWLGWEELSKVSNNTAWLWGLCADHRFGDYRLYPLLGMQWHLKGNINLRLAFPDTALRWQPSDSHYIELTLQPIGREWTVYDKNFARQSELQWRAWEFELKLHWQFAKHWQTFVSTGLRFEQKLQLRLENNQRLKSDLDDSPFLLLGVSMVW